MARNHKNSDRSSWLDDNLPEELVDSTVFKFKITLQNETVVEVELGPDVDIDYDNLEQQLAECPQQYIYWNTLYSEMRAVAGLMERRIKVVRGILTGLAVDMTKDEKGLRLTNEQIKLVIEKDEKLVTLENKLVRIQKQVGKLYGMCTALQMKSEHLRSLAGFKRGEMQVQR